MDVKVCSNNKDKKEQHNSKNKELTMPLFTSLYMRKFDAWL